jgi:hypothetical protein
LEQRAAVLGRLMHFPHVAGYHAYLESPGLSAGGFQPLAQGLQGHQLELTNVVAFSVDQGL